MHVDASRETQANLSLAREPRQAHDAAFVALESVVRTREQEKDRSTMADVKPTPVLTGLELEAYSSVNSICCNDATRQFTAEKRDKIHPIKMEKTREKVEQCFSKTFHGMKAACSAQYDDVVACLSGNERTKYKCAAARSALEECAAKNRLGELEGL